MHTPWYGLSSVLVCAAVLTGGAASMRAQVLPAAPAVDVLLTVSVDLPDAARDALLQEAAALWRQAGVAIEWLPPVGHPVGSGGPRLRLLVVERAAVHADAGDRRTVGELVHGPDGEAVAFVSIAEARRILAQTTQPGLQPTGADARRLGIVLGRAAAHEIGHYLLDSPLHSPRGLMRAAFDARDFTDPRSGAFALDREASSRLRTRLQRAPATH